MSLREVGGRFFPTGSKPSEQRSCSASAPPSPASGWWWSRRVFVRSLNETRTGWFRAFLEIPEGSASLPELELPVRAKRTLTFRLKEAVTAAYADESAARASEKWSWVSWSLGPSRRRSSSSRSDPREVSPWRARQAARLGGPLKAWEAGEAQAAISEERCRRLGFSRRYSRAARHGPLARPPRGAAPSDRPTSRAPAPGTARGAPRPRSGSDARPR